MIYSWLLFQLCIKLAWCTVLDVSTVYMNLPNNSDRLFSDDGIWVVHDGFLRRFRLLEGNIGIFWLEVLEQKYVLNLWASSYVQVEISCINLARQLKHLSITKKSSGILCDSRLTLHYVFAYKFVILYLGPFNPANVSWTVEQTPQVGVFAAQGQPFHINFHPKWFKKNRCYND